MAELYEMTGIVSHIIYQNEDNGYTVMELDVEDDFVTAVGEMPAVAVGDSLHVFGFWVEHPSFGPQFSVKSFEQAKPETSADILRYLSSGAVKGIGSATAEKLVREFGEKTLDIIADEPERLCVIKGITEAKAKAISEEYNRVSGMKELIIFLNRFGIGTDSAVKVWKAFGPLATSAINDNPFVLCGEGIGISFKRADKIAAEMNRPKDDVNRIKQGIKYVLTHNEMNGYTFLPEDRLIEASGRLLRVEEEKISAALDDMVSFNALIREDIPLQSGPRTSIFLPRLYDAERNVAEKLAVMLRFPARAVWGVDEAIEDIENSTGITYAGQQREAISMALKQGLLILTGKPGTGKTTTLDAIITILEQKGERVFLAAPTGRAAKRMSEVTGREAKTIHRLLEVEWGDERIHFTRNERHHLECDALVLDEVSMLDVQLLDSVLKALPMGCRLIMVGDSHQLPSVGAGNVLSDLIRSELVPVVELNEIFRQAMKSLIVTNAHRIINGEMPDLKTRDSDFFFIKGDSAAAISQTIVDLCSKRLEKSYGYTVQNDIQVLTPSRKGDLGTAELNKVLQEACNPKTKRKKEITFNGITFREGDKVMQIKNNYDIMWRRDDGTEGEGVFNGDVGTLMDIDPVLGAFYVKMDDKLVMYTKENMSELELAYAMTIHKSQGNEFTAVIIPMFPGPVQLYFRNLLYTGITRAKSLLILVGLQKTVKAMVDNDKKTKRYTALRQFLTEAVEKSGTDKQD